MNDQSFAEAHGRTIYLHWTATGYDWIRPSCYHVIIGGDGRVHRLHATSMDLRPTPVPSTTMP